MAIVGAGYELAIKVAREIRDGFDSHLTKASGLNGAHVLVTVPSLQGKSAAQIGLSAGMTGDFASQVYGVESGTYRDGMGYTRSRRLLSDLGFDIRVKEDGVCTGEVLVSQLGRDYDL